MNRCNRPRSKTQRLLSPAGLCLLFNLLLTTRMRPHCFRSTIVLAFQPARTTTTKSLSNLYSNLAGPRRSSTQLSSSYQTQENEKRVQERLLQEQEKRRVRHASKLELHARHLKTKSLLQTDSSLSNNLIAVKVTVDSTLRSELKLNGREKRGRMFLTPNSDSCTTIQGLRREIHDFFRCLKKSTFILKAGLPTVTEDGSILSPEDDDTHNYSHQFWPLENDQHVIQTLIKAQDFYSTHSNQSESNLDRAPLLKRPSFILRVEKDPHAPSPPPPPHYLENMADPSMTDSMTMLSFYAFPPNGIENPEDFSVLLKKAWKPFHALGRVYVAQEGVNAQMSVPSNVIQNFMACCRSIPELGSYMENGINIDPIRLSMEEFSVAGDMNGKPAPPFRALHIRVRHQVVADGLNHALNWQSAGYDMPPLEWHQKLIQARDKVTLTNDGTSDARTDIPIILDCRNKYETNVGRFVGAEPLDTDSFRETWDALKDRLKDTPKDAPIMTYCTGGIRCVKVGAYLTQEMGFTNVSRLAGGIISYDRAIQSQENPMESMFKGTNYVFDGRVGRQITEDALADCVTCGGKTSLISNCNNENCHKRITQCNACRSSYVGTCSDACRIRVLNSGLRPADGVENTFFSTRVGGSTAPKRFLDLDEYSSSHSSSPSATYAQIIENTKTFFPSGAHMVSGAQQGLLLTTLASMTREGRILELGTFTGYATACFLEGATNVATALNYSGCGESVKGPFVLSLERDNRAFSLAARHLHVITNLGMGPDSVAELSRIRDMELDEVELDSVNFQFKNAGCKIVRVNDALAYVEALSVNYQKKTAPFDLIFVDADKTRLIDYMEVFLKNDRILKKGGIIIVDNVLWKGGVLRTAVDQVKEQAFDTISISSEAELRKSRRARKLAHVMHQFNTIIMEDPRVEVVILPMRDGLSIIRKKV